MALTKSKLIDQPVQPVKRASEIDAASVRVNAAEKRLVELVDALKSAIAPVLTPYPPDSSNVGETKGQAVAKSPIADYLEMHAYTLESVSEDIERLLSRIEL